MSLIKPFLSLTMLLLALASVAAGNDAALPAFFPKTESVAVLFAEDLDVDWQAEVQLTAAPVHAGASALTVTPDQSLNLHTRTPILADQVDRLRFWIHGGAHGGQLVRVAASPAAEDVRWIVAPAGWTLIEIPVESLDTAQIDELIIEILPDGAQTPVYLDEIGWVLR